jgi:hypothetical protein
MAFIYTRSSDGDDSDNGTTWALAKASIAGASGAASIEAAGDVIVAASGHTESHAANVTIALSGSVTTTTSLISVNDTGNPEPPTAALAGATVETTGSAILTIVAATVESPVYVEGMNFIAGDGGGTARIDVISTARAPMTFKDCLFYPRCNSTLARVGLQNNGNNSATIRLINPTFRFANAAGTARVSGAFLDIRGGGLHASTVSPTNLFDGGFNVQHVVRWVGGDLSSAGTGMNLIAATALNMAWDAVFRRMKLPSGWTGGLSAAGTLGPSRIELHESMAGTTPINLWIRTTQGEIRDEQTIQNNDGASGESHSYVTTANASPLTPLVGHEIVVPNTTTGSAITLTLAVLTDNVTLTNEQCYMEVRYKDSSGFDQVVSSQMATLGTPANLTTSTADWTTTGLTTPTKQQMSVTFTPGSAGYLIVTPYVGRASTTVYVDTNAVVS